MKRRRVSPVELVIGYLILCACVVVIAGCSTDPRTRWAEAREALTVSQDIALTLHATGSIDDETLVEVVDPAVQTARAGLARAEELLPDGPGVLDWLDIIEAALLRLAVVIEEYRHGTG